MKFTELERCLLCKYVAQSICRSVRLCTDCLSANQIKKFVPYSNQYTIMYPIVLFFLWKIEAEVWSRVRKNFKTTKQQNKQKKNKKEKPNNYHDYTYTTNVISIVGKPCICKKQ